MINPLTNEFVLPSLFPSPNKPFDQTSSSQSSGQPSGVLTKESLLNLFYSKLPEETAFAQPLRESTLLNTMKHERSFIKLTPTGATLSKQSPFRPNLTTARTAPEFTPQRPSRPPIETGLSARKNSPGDFHGPTQTDISAIGDRALALATEALSLPAEELPTKKLTVRRQPPRKAKTEKSWKMGPTRLRETQKTEVAPPKKKLKL